MCKTKAVHNVSCGKSEPEGSGKLETDLLSVIALNRVTNSPAFVVNVNMNGKEVPMELDTGSAVSLMAEREFIKFFPGVECSDVDVRLITYNGTPVPVKGSVKVRVEYNGQTYHLSLVIAKNQYEGRMPTLLGRDWLAKIRLNWPELVQVNSLDEEKSLNKEKSLREKFPDVFEPGYGAIKGFQGSIVVREDANPVFCKARPVPYALSEVVEKEIKDLEKAGVIFRVRHSAWATPLVIVPKKNSTAVRLCGDYRVTVNPNIKVDHYPLPVPEDIFASLVGGTVFTVLDLSKAYLQLELDEKAQELLTVNTHMGLFRFRRLPYGVASAPAMFQAVMDQILQGIPGTACYLDDVLVAGKDHKECYTRVEQVLQNLSTHGIRVNVGKCKFFQSQVQYLGHMLDSRGLHPTEEKVEAIRKAPEPTNLTQLKAFLGLVNYYSRFLPNLATLLEPMHALLRQSNEWEWSSQCANSFNACKKLLCESQILELYDVHKEIQLTCDASAYGLGAVMSHIVDGVEKPIAFASRSMSPAERNYAHIEKEALAIVFGVKKFQKYLYGRTFKVVTDHQPLTVLFDTKRPASAVAVARIHRWLTFLADYSYRIVYKSGKTINNADGLSRLPLPSTTDNSDEIFYFSPASELPVTSKDVERETAKDKVLSAVREMTCRGWPQKVSDEYQPFFVRRFELSVDMGCLVWNNRVIVPKSLQDDMLSLLHEQHMGITKMKAVARAMVWWPSMDKALEDVAKRCGVCQSVVSIGQPAPLQPWRWCTYKWERVHLDFAEKEGKTWLLAVDSYSKWLEVKIMTSTTAQRTIETVREWFAAHGLPVEIVTDNGPQFRSKEFTDFLRSNGVKHTLTPPYHPQSNGAAERAVQTVKKSLLKQLLEDQQHNQKRSMQHRLDNFLFAYRTSPHTFTDKTPAELFLGRKLRTRLSLVKPDMKMAMQEKVEKTKCAADKRRCAPKVFSVGDRVFVRTVRGETVKWWQGTIKSVKSPMTYLVLVNGQVRFVHVDHLRRSFQECRSEMPFEARVSLPHDADVCDASVPCEPPMVQAGHADTQSSDVASNTSPHPAYSGSPTDVGVALRRSTRTRRPPDRFGHE